MSLSRNPFSLRSKGWLLPCGLLSVHPKTLKSHRLLAGATRVLGCTLSVALWTASARAQSDDEDDKPRPPAETVRLSQQKLLDTAKSIGPWESQYQIIEDATDRIFEQQGWTSESDQFARQVMRDVGRVAPWDPQKRQEVFNNQLQMRYNLTHDQVSQFNTDFQREGMRLAIKHFKDVMPVALEVANTRARNEPFTPQQVQEWTRKLRPLMDESAESIERVGDKLSQSMTADQRRRLQTDLKSFRRRQEDVQKMAERWAGGQWTPADWGLQADPVHSGEMVKYAQADAEKTALVEAVVARKPDERLVAKDESEWERYVKWFCNTYQCNDRQRTTAAAILASAKKEAISYHNARRATINQLERDMKSAEGMQRKTIAAELDRALTPITETFERMKKRLYEEVLTTHQRLRFAPPQSAKADKKKESD